MVYQLPQSDMEGKKKRKTGKLGRQCRLEGAILNRIVKKDSLKKFHLKKALTVVE